jgi:hypothetical protein
MMSDDRNLDGTHKGLDRDRQNAAGVNWTTNKSDAQRMMWEKDLANDAAIHAKKMKNLQNNNQPVDYSAFAGSSMHMGFLGFLFIVAAIVCACFAMSFYHDAQNFSQKANATSEVVSFPESTNGTKGELSVQLREFLTDSQSIFPGKSSSSGNVFNHCQNSNCTFPSTQALIQYVYPYVKHDSKSQQRFLSYICHLDDAQESLRLAQNKKLVLKATPDGCAITNYENVKGLLSMAQNYYQQQSSRALNTAYRFMAGTLACGIIGLLLVFRRKKR